MYYRSCPKCGHQRESRDTLPRDRCPACGLVYEKWFRARFSLPRSGRKREKRPARWAGLRDLLFDTPAASTPGSFFLYCTLLVIMAVWGWYFMQLDYYTLVNGQRIDSAAPEIYESFLHGVNLIFHEAGHVIFMPFGEFIGMLGGSLMQLLVPLFVGGFLLLRQREPFGAAVALWWAGQNLLDIAPYINDARAGNIVLLGGVTGSEAPQHHDWWNILYSVGWLPHDHAIAAVAHGSGTLIMLLSIFWAAGILRIQYQRLRRG